MNCIRTLLRTAVGLIGLTLLLIAAPASWAEEPCCNITGIRGDGLVSATEIATGRVFQFKVTEANQLRSLRIGQPIYADFATNKVSVNGEAPCCNIVAGAGGVNPETPCCTIAGIRPDGLVSATETATGRAFQFKVNDASLLRSLRVGQQIYADFAASKVSVNGAAPCCAILAGAGGLATPAAAPGVNPADPCCTLVPNAALGALGQLVVAFPAGVDAGFARTEVFAAGAARAMSSGYGPQRLSLAPGTYDVTVSNHRLKGVSIRPGHDTVVKVGVLRVQADANTRVEVWDAAKKQKLVWNYGNAAIGLPAGTYAVSLGKDSSKFTPVVIRDSAVADFRAR